MTAAQIVALAGRAAGNAIVHGLGERDPGDSIVVFASGLWLYGDTQEYGSSLGHLEEAVLSARLDDENTSSVLALQRALVASKVVTMWHDLSQEARNALLDALLPQDGAR